MANRTYDDRTKDKLPDRKPRTAGEAPGQNNPAAPTVQFHEWDCLVEFVNYANGRTGLVLRDARDGEEVAVATVNVPDAQLGPKEVLVKDYSENHGMLAALEKAGIVRSTARTIESSFVTLPVCELLISPPGKQKDRKQSVAELEAGEKERRPGRQKSRDCAMER